MNYWWADFDGYDVGFFRLGGPGLGNLLFPWARAILGASKSAGQIVWPTWRQIKMGPIIRMESDIRMYSGIFFADQHDITGFKKFNLLKSSAILCEKEIGDYYEDGAVVRVRGMGKQFNDLSGGREIILSAIKKRVRGDLLNQILINRKQDTVAVHVRLGDFTPAGSVGVANLTSNTSTPISWYVEIIKNILLHDKNIKFELHSDGSNYELMDLLCIDNVYRPKINNAMHGILAMANCGFMLASGSTFSKWASFLGGVPAVYYPGQMRDLIHYDGIYEKEIFSSDFDGNIVCEQLKRNYELL